MNRQFMLLGVLNVFVGAMIGLERSVLPVIGERDFALASTSAALSFIVSFGVTKAFVNLVAGRLADHFGRRTVLLVGWGFGLFVPLLVLYAPNWSWIVFANVLLGLHQGLAWSMTVNMKLDLIDEQRRGLAIGLNEFAGYSGVAIAALVSSYVGARDELFIGGFLLALIGTLLAFTTKETKHQSTKRQQTQHFTSLRHFHFAGLATNFKDGMAWGLFPTLLLSKQLSWHEIGVVVAIYPATWGFLQLFTGSLSDRIGRHKLIISGMVLQSAALLIIVSTTTYPLLSGGAILLGMGTALVYPTLQAAISDAIPLASRASALGLYRFWRDSGYAFGALSAGLIADFFSVPLAIYIGALLPLLAALYLAKGANYDYN